jgi:hypothetical protein
MQRTLNLLAAVGLALGAVFGLAGTLVEQPGLRSTFWGIDGAGLVMAASLLTLKYLRKANDIVAAGFLVFAIGQGVILSGAAAGLSGSLPSFAAGTALWATALLLISIPSEFPLPVRLIGILTAALFALTSLQILSGAALSPVSSPLPFFAYPFLVLTLIGWIWRLMRESLLPRARAESRASSGGTHTH